MERNSKKLHLILDRRLRITALFLGLFIQTIQEVSVQAVFFQNLGKFYLLLISLFYICRHQRTLRKKCFSILHSKQVRYLPFLIQRFLTQCQFQYRMLFKTPLSVLVPVAPHLRHHQHHREIEKRPLALKER